MIGKGSKGFVRTLVAGASIMALAFSAACGSGQSAAGSGAKSGDITQQTIKPGKLTIATGEPAYEPWVMNDKPQSGKGFEAALAYAVAGKLGFSKSDVVWTRTTFDTAIAPGPKDWDLNIQQFGITQERKKAVDFSSSYYNDTQSVIVKKDSKYADATSLSELKGAKVGAMIGTEGYDYAKKLITDDVQTFNDDAAVAQALDAGQIDAMVAGTVESVYIVQSGQVKNAKVIGKVPGSQDHSGTGIVLPKDSKLTAPVTKAIDELKADGTLQKLQDTWLAEYTTDLTELAK
ncbi:MAG: ABC transporter substrate-binding protein [Bifidobacterium sp.]|jgi:polar amino acid transport system substrate-binding protein|nr:ABC transporter substrate-binding protein [Bifidobacterium sp.]